MNTGDVLLLYAFDGDFLHKFAMLESSVEADARASFMQ